MPAIEVEKLNVWMQAGDGRIIHAVKNANLSLGNGGQLAIIGESGSGKSTLLMALLGLLPPNASVSGHVIVNGVDVFEGPEAALAGLRWREVAMVFQASSNPLSPVHMIGQQLTRLLVFHGHDPKRAKARMRELLDMVRLPAPCEQLYPHQLSGGMRQRVVIAFALACQPKVLLADEPTTALDPIVQAEIIELILALRQSLDLALVLVSHDLALVGRMQGDLAVMLAGDIVEYGPVTQLMTKPKHEHLRTLLAALPDFGLVEEPA